MASQLDIIAERYVLEAEISRGGMAIVFQARDDVLARPVAVKVLHSHLSEDASFLERFRREALAAAGLSHPNIVAIYDTGTHPGGEGEPPLQYIVMEHCSGGTLDDLLSSQGPLPPERVVSIGVAICEALGYAHRENIIHRDVKPANVLLADDGLLKVADFGIAKAAFAEKELTTTGSILGTVTYLSPEQGQGLEPGPGSDLYALGVVLYELSVGRPPFVADSSIATALAHLKTPPPPLRSIKAGVPRPLEAVIMKALEKDPDARFSSAEAMRDALESSVGRTNSSLTTPIPVRSLPVRSPASARTKRVPRRRNVAWLVWVIVALVAIAGGAVLVSSLDQGGRPAPAPGTKKGRPAAGAGNQITVAAVSDFDPYGGDGEHPEEAPAAIDGDRTTSWTTQTYSSSLETLAKPGVGLVFDLGDEVEVSKVKVIGSAGMDLEIRAGDSCEGDDETRFDKLAAQSATSATSRFTFPPTSARCWLVWITALSQEGSGIGAIAEVEFLGG